MNIEGISIYNAVPGWLCSDEIEAEYARSLRDSIDLKMDHSSVYVFAALDPKGTSKQFYGRSLSEGELDYFLQAQAGLFPMPKVYLRVFIVPAAELRCMLDYFLVDIDFESSNQIRAELTRVIENINRVKQVRVVGISSHRVELAFSGKVLPREADQIQSILITGSSVCDIGLGGYLMDWNGSSTACPLAAELVKNQALHLRWK